MTPLDHLDHLSSLLVPVPKAPDFKGFITPSRFRSAWHLGVDRLSAHEQFALKAISHGLDEFMACIRDTVLIHTKDIGFGVSLVQDGDTPLLSLSFASREDAMVMAAKENSFVQTTLIDFAKRLTFIQDNLGGDREWAVRGAPPRQSMYQFNLKAKDARTAIELTRAFTRPHRDWDDIATLMEKGFSVRECDHTEPQAFEIQPDDEVNHAMRVFERACNSAEKALRSHYYDHDELPDMAEASVSFTLMDPVHPLSEPQIGLIMPDRIENDHQFDMTALEFMTMAQCALADILMMMASAPGMSNTPTDLRVTLIFLECDTEIVFEGTMGRKSFSRQGMFVKEFKDTWTPRLAGLRQLPEATHLYAIGYGFSDVALVSGSDAGTARVAYSLLLGGKPFEGMKAPAHRVPKLLETLPELKQETESEDA